MSEMIIRVAQAIGETVPGRNQFITPWTMAAARAAIEAMREPTPGMRQTGVEADDKRTGNETRASNCRRHQSFARNQNNGASLMTLTATHPQLYSYVKYVGEVRWNNGHLEQRVQIMDYVEGSLVGIEQEWRVVPTVAAEPEAKA